MDFLKILHSFEALIFEATSWLLFYPKTLWRIVTRPLGTMDYSDAEQADSEERRYDDAISPPLLLLFTVVMVNLLGMALHIPPPASASPTLKAILSSPQNASLFRALLFALVPLVAATSLLGRRKVRLSRETLRPPFYAQCYLVTPVALVVSLGGIIFQRADVSNIYGVVLMVGGMAWFLAAQTRWFGKQLGMGPVRAFTQAAGCFLLSLLYLLVILTPVVSL